MELPAFQLHSAEVQLPISSANPTLPKELESIHHSTPGVQVVNYLRIRCMFGMGKETREQHLQCVDDGAVFCEEKEVAYKSRSRYCTVAIGIKRIRHIFIKS